MDELIREAKERLIVSIESAKEYEEKKDLILDFVNREMSKRTDIAHLIGGNPFQMMYDNHRNHVNFMSNVFKYSIFEVLVRIVPWVYKSYHNHDFSYDYSPAELNTWKAAIKKFLSKGSYREIVKTYDWMMEKHERMIELSKRQGDFIVQLEKDWQDKKKGKGFARTLKRTIRQEDIFGRIGGEEFALMLPITNGNQALEASERIRKEVERIKIKGIKGNITASFGITELSLSDDYKSFLKRADDALYEAKRNGRNRCEMK